VSGLTFGCKQLFLGRGLPIDTVEGKRELFSLVLGVWDLDDGQRFPLLDAVGAHNDIFVKLFFKQRADSSNNTH
jgi:hypothetical protein